MVDSARLEQSWPGDCFFGGSHDGCGHITFGVFDFFVRVNAVKQQDLVLQADDAADDETPQPTHLPQQVYHLKKTETLDNVGIFR